jgi:hypothetical protein
MRLSLSRCEWGIHVLAPRPLSIDASNNMIPYCQSDSSIRQGIAGASAAHDEGFLIIGG